MTVEELKDVIVYLQGRIEELESKFAQDFSENTFNEIKELKNCKISTKLNKLLIDFYKLGIIYISGL